MQIESIETFQLEAPIERSFGWSQGWVDRRYAGVVKITCDDGTVGWGEGGGESEHALIHGPFANLLLGADPLERNQLWEKMFAQLYNGNAFGGIGGNAISAIDIALWDLAGKALDAPVSTLLGGRIRDRVAVYATGLYYTEGEFPDRLLDEARSYVDSGYMGMKTKVGGLSHNDDLSRVSALREAIGPDIYLMVDANQAYNAASAIRLGRALADLDIYWFEEPVGAKNLEGYLQVKNALPMALSGGENLRTRFEAIQYIERRVVDILQPDVAIIGGITELSRVALMANAAGILCNPHVWGTPIMIAASLHVASTIPSCPPARDPQPFQQEPVMEFDRTPNAIRQTISPKPFEQEAGYLAVPDGPGLGVEIDEEALSHLTVAHRRSERS